MRSVLELTVNNQAKRKRDWGLREKEILEREKEIWEREKEEDSVAKIFAKRPKGAKGCNSERIALFL